MRIETPLLILGGGPAALAAAEIASGYRTPSLVVGHVSGQGANPEYPVALDAEAVAALTPHGVLDVLRPYLVVVDPPTLSPHVFEDVLKQHSVADFNVTVYDTLSAIERRPAADGVGLEAVLSDGKTNWEVAADAFIDTAGYPEDLSAAINRAATEVRAILRRANAS